MPRRTGALRTTPTDRRRVATARDMAHGDYEPLPDADGYKTLPDSVVRDMVVETLEDDRGEGPRATEAGRLPSSGRCLIYRRRGEWED